MSRSVSTAEVIGAAIDARMASVHTMLIGRVERVHAAARKVDVQPATQRVVQTVSGGLLTDTLPLLQQVPIGALRAGAARIDMPITVGCWVCVLFFEDNVGKWLNAGGVQVSPGDVERHGLTGAVAVPLLYPDPETRELPALSATDIVIAIDGGPELRLTPSAVEVTGNLIVTGSVSAGGQVTAMAETAPVGLATHVHNTAMGPSGPPNPST